MLHMTVYSQPNPVLPLIQQYAIMGCAFQLVAAYDPNASPYDFREPDQPGLTKHGWIKFEVISTLLEGNEVCTPRVFDINRLRLMPLPQRHRETTTSFRPTLPILICKSRTPPKGPFSLGGGTRLFHKDRQCSGMQSLLHRRSVYEGSRKSARTYGIG